MPASNNEDMSFVWPNSGSPKFSQTVPNSPINSPCNSGHTSPNSLPSSPVHMIRSPPRSPTFFPLRRNYSSTFTLIPEDRVVHSISSTPRTKPTRPQADPEPNAFNTASDIKSLLFRIILWWPLSIVHLIRTIVNQTAYSIQKIAAPTFWLSVTLWTIYKLCSFPLFIVKFIISTFQTSAHERQRQKRTVLISGGNSIQALQMARNFYSAGFRVVVFDIDDLFGLSQFSTAVSKYYSIPKPRADSPDKYIASLCRIVNQEKPSYFVPVCSSSAAHFDGLAKPHLELLGCSSFIPGTQEISVLDDISEIFQKCQSNEISVPPHRMVTSVKELSDLYSSGWLNEQKHFMVACGKSGTLERQRFVLPSQPLLDFNQFRREISDSRPWIVIRDFVGTHYVTCTTVKDSRLVANVCCSVQPTTRSLVPDHSKDVDEWLTEFFAKVRLQRPINAHISFRFVRCKQTNQLLPLGARVGVGLPYICHTGVHSRVLWKPCPHFSRQKSGPIVQDEGRYWIHDVVLNTLKHPSFNAVSNLIGTVLDKREAIFIYWDPLPYCAYYHLQLPIMMVRGYLQRIEELIHSRL